MIYWDAERRRLQHWVYRHQHVHRICSYVHFIELVIPREKPQNEIVQEETTGVWGVGQEQRESCGTCARTRCPGAAA